LGHDSEVALAVLGTAVALGKRSLIKIKLVIKAEFFALLNVLDGEDAHADLAEHVPLLRLAIRVARVVDEASYVPVERGINYFIIRSPHQIGTGRVLIALYTLAANLGISGKYLSRVLHDEGVFRDELPCQEAPPLVLRFNRIHVCYLVQLESFICAKRATRTCVRRALSEHAAVQAEGPAVNTQLRVRPAGQPRSYFSPLRDAAFEHVHTRF